MTDLKISQFAGGSAIQTTDEIAAVRGGVNTKVFAGSAAALDAGLGVGDLIQLEDDGSGNGRLPAIDISQGYGLSSLPPDGNYGVITISSGVWNFTDGSYGDIDISSNSFDIVNPALASIKNLTTAADNGIYTTALDTYTTYTLTAAGRALLDDADNAAQRTTLVAAMSPVINGMTVSNNVTDAAHDIDITAGSCVDDSKATILTRASQTGAQTDVTFGTGSGILASGESFPTSGTIHIWVIGKADGTTAFFANVHATSGLNPTLPATYIYKRRIRSVYVTASAIIPEIQVGNLMVRPTPTIVLSGVIGTGNTTVDLTTPDGIRVNAATMGRLAAAAGGTGIQISTSEISINQGWRMIAAAAVEYASNFIIMPNLNGEVILSATNSNVVGFVFHLSQYTDLSRELFA